MSDKDIFKSNYITTFLQCYSTKSFIWHRTYFKIFTKKNIDENKKYPHSTKSHSNIIMTLFCDNRYVTMKSQQCHYDMRMSALSQMWYRYDINVIWNKMLLCILYLTYIWIYILITYYIDWFIRVWYWQYTIIYYILYVVPFSKLISN